MNYPETLEYLYGLTDYEKERIARYDPETLDLSRVRRVLARLGNPHERYPSIHIAGTKGKGSVAAMCAAVLRAAHMRTGLYTSPHLHTFRERIQVDGALIPITDLTSLVVTCRPAFDAEPELTTFEAITVLSFVYFEQCQVDCAVVEVGLGGRLDATNVITPQVSVITSLSFDHTYLLGDTLGKIAYEKAGIIKPGVPTVCEPQEDEALEVIERVCAERESPLTVVGREWDWQRLSFSLEGQFFELRHVPDPSPLDGCYTIPLLGRHQLNNAVAAIAALDVLQLQPDQIRQGLSQVTWPGRLEVLRPAPPLIVDCAHNGDSAAKLSAALEEWFPGQRWTFIVGVSNDKDVVGILRALAPHMRRLLVTHSRHSRAMPPEQLAELAVQILPTVRVEAVSDVPTAMALALDGGDFICVTGSVFVVADAREAWALCMKEAPCHVSSQPLLPVSLADLDAALI